MVRFSLGLFLVVTGVAFLTGTVLRLLYIMYQRSRSGRDVLNVMKNLRFRDIEYKESSSSDDDDDDDDDDENVAVVEKGGTQDVVVGGGGGGRV